MTLHIISLGMYDCKRIAIIRSHVTPGVAVLKVLSTNQEKNSTWENARQILRQHPTPTGIRNLGWTENCLAGSLPGDSDGPQPSITKMYFYPNKS